MDEKISSPRERMKEITDSIENGIRELFNSDRYKDYLRTMSRFHNYSYNNTMLIHLQRPDASRVASFNKWKKDFHRNVKKGEKGIQIIVPAIYKKKVEEVQIDPETNAPLLDENGQTLMSEREIVRPSFKIGYVFDVSQTEGEPLPQLAATLDGHVEKFDIYMEALRRFAPVPVEFQPLAANMDGYFSEKEQKIVLREGMSEVQTFCAAVHETAHSMLHNVSNTTMLGMELQEIEIFGQKGLFSNGRINRDKLPDGLFCYDLRGSDYDPGQPIMVENKVVVNHAGCVITGKPIQLDEHGIRRLGAEMNFVGGNMTVKDFWQDVCPEKANKDRRTQETEAESVAFSVCSYYGVDTSENSFGYLASWASDKSLKELKASLETINKTANVLITDMDKNVIAICKERGIDLTPKEAEPQAHEALFLLDDDIYLHVQRRSEDIDYDYSLYTASTLKLMDGGVTSLPEDSTLIDAPLITVAEEILVDYGIVYERLEPIDLNKLHEIEAANSVSPPAEIMPESEPVRELGELDEYPMPDATVDPKQFEKAGIDDADILPVSRLSALMFMEEDFSVYSVTKEAIGADVSMCMDSDEIKAYPPETMFAIDREEWEKSLMFQHMIDERLAHQEEREAGFFAHPGSFAIYQMDHSLDSIPLRFSGYDELVERGMAPTRDMYELIYTAELGKKGLDDIFYEFNENRPPDYRSYSLSASDIIARNEDGTVSYYYVDRFGFQELPDFAAENPLKNAEMAVEDDYNMVDGIINNGSKQPTVEELEQQARSGQPISLMDLADAVHREQSIPDDAQPKRMSIYDKLRQPLPPKAKKSTPVKSAEMEM